MTKPQYTPEQWIEKKKKTKEERYLYQKNYNKLKARNLRASILTMLGSKCCKCGFSDIRALQIDHLNGDGAEERKKLSNRGKNNGVHPLVFYPIVIKSLLNNENKYQLLCANCNWIKRIENKESGTQKHNRGL
jgi:hypothetical protein